MDEDNSSIPETQKLGIRASPLPAPEPHAEPPFSVRSETESQTDEWRTRDSGLRERIPTLGSTRKHDGATKSVSGVVERKGLEPFHESERIAELIGAILGDGNIYDKRPSYIELCGNPSTDLDYFEHVLLPIVRTEIHRNPRLFVRDGGLRFRINSKSFVEWLQEAGVPAGEAKAHGTIPNFIVAQNELLINCIRGVFDTDGSVYFDKRATYRRPYPRIDLHMRNLMLLEQLTVLLRNLGIPHSFVRSRGSIETAGVDALRDFLETIGFSNSHHISRIRNQYPELIRFNSGPAHRDCDK
jgi:hypothetical protein